MVRDPRDVFISGYFYHKKLRTREPWLFEKYEKFNDMGYQEYINTLSLEDGLIAELELLGDKDKIESFVQWDKWDYNNPRIMELKYEDYILQDDKFVNIFKHYGFNEEEIQRSMNIVRERNLDIVKSNEPNNQFVSIGVPNTWKKYFTPNIKAEFKKRYDYLLIKLGYEKNTNW